MNFMFEWQEILFLPREHKIHIFELTCNVLFIILIYWWRRFWWFPEDFRPLSERFPKIFQNFPEGQTNVPEHFLIISKNFWGLQKTLRKTWRCFDGTPTKYNLRDKLDISEIINIFTCEDIVSFLSSCYHSLYHWLLYNKIHLLYRRDCFTGN